MVEMRSKIFKAKGGAVQVLTIVDILSMTKAIDEIGRASCRERV